MLKVKWLLTFAVLLILSACGGAAATPAPATNIDVSSLPVNINVQTAASVQGRDDVILIDVREQSEYDAGHIPGITLVPMSDIQNRLDEIPTDKEVIVTCRSGNRSGQVTDFLRQNGFDNVHNMQGGILAWEQAGYPVEQ